MLEDKLQLHQIIEIHYYVDHYEAVFLTADGNREVARASGDNIAEALTNLEIEILDFDGSHD